MRKITLVAGIGALVLAGGAAAETVETIERSFRIEGTPEIRVRNEDGRTTLTSHDGPSVEVRAVKEVLHADSEDEARELAESVEVRIEQNGARVRVETIHPERDRGFWRDDARVLVHVEVWAPRSSHLDVESEDGPLTVQGFEGRHRLVSEDGDLRVADCGGELDVSAEDGDVELLSIRGAVRARLEDGDLRLEGAITDLSAEAEDGLLDVRLEPGSSMSSDWSLRSEDGRVELWLPADFAASLDVRVDDGSISVDHTGSGETRISDERWTSELNGGGHRLRVRTEDGSVRIEQT